MKWVVNHVGEALMFRDKREKRRTFTRIFELNTITLRSYDVKYDNY